MKTIKILSLCLALFAVKAVAQEVQEDKFQLWMDEELAVQNDGSTVTYLTVSQYDPDHNYLGFNMEFNLPEGLKINQVKNGREMKNDIALSERATSTHNISCNMPDSKTLKVACISTANQELYPDDEDGNILYPLFTIGLVAEPTTVLGTYEVEMSGISFTRRGADNALIQKTIDKLGTTLTLTVTDDITGIDGIVAGGKKLVNVYNPLGQLIRSGVEAGKALEGLSQGVYVINGKKYIVE